MFFDVTYPAGTLPGVIAHRVTQTVTGQLADHRHWSLLHGPLIRSPVPTA